MLTDIWRDLTQAVRSLAKARAFSLVVVISLGIGMVPVIAVPYGSRILTAAPPGLDTDALVEVVTTPRGDREATYEWSYPDFVALRDAGTGITMTGWTTGNTNLLLDPARGGKTTARALFVSSNYFSTIGVRLMHGTGFPATPDPAVVVAHAFWQRRLGSDPAAVGTPLIVNQVSHTIVGIAPEGFGGHVGFQNVDLFVPLEWHPAMLATPEARSDRSREWVLIHGRLAPGTSIAQANATVSAVTAQLAKDHPRTNELKAGIVAPYDPRGSLGAAQFAIMRTVAQTLATLPLLVVCLNIAGMVQVRSAIRERELSIRQAIGASRRRLMQHLLAESLVLAALGALLASLVLFNVAPVTAWWLDTALPPGITEALRIDVSMIAICVGLCLATSLVFGWLPAARFSRPVIVTALKDDAGGGGTRVGRVQRVAAALQIAIATPLLILGGMTLDRVRATMMNDLGFASELLYAAPISTEGLDAAAAWSRIQGVRETLGRAGGVASVTVADGLPLDFRYRLTRVATQAAANAAPRIVLAHLTRVGDGYLETLGIPLLRGRAFGVDDRAGAGDVAIVSQPFAERLFPGEDAVGKRVTFAAGEKTERSMTIVGVTGDFPTSQMSTEREQLLVPLAQHPDITQDSVGVEDDRGGRETLMLVARSVPGESPLKLTAALEQVLREVDPEFEPTRIVTGVWLRQNSVNDFMTQSMVAGVAGGILLFLAALGIYGVVGLMVATRIREIAVRVALGASRSRVVVMVLADVAKLVAPGIVIGVLLALAFVRIQDFGMALSGLEPLGYVTGSALALLTALAASLAPAWRATSVQPTVAMRSE